MTIDTQRLATALDAIGRAGGNPSDLMDAWEGTVDSGAQVFVSLAPRGLQKGDPYVTWLVTLAPDGSVLALDRFSSTTCRPLAAKA